MGICCFLLLLQMLLNNAVLINGKGLLGTQKLKEEQHSIEEKEKLALKHPPTAI